MMIDSSEEQVYASTQEQLSGYLKRIKGLREILDSRC